MGSFYKHRGLRLAALLALGLFMSVDGAAQKKAKAQPKKDAPPPATDVSKLRDEYINATKDYKASLQKLLELYKGSVKKVEQKHEQMQKLFAQGLVSKL